jgi:predicted dehydrogenase
VTIRLAVAGYGWMAAQHLPVFRALGAEVAAASNRSEAGRGRARDEGGIARTYASPGEMVEHERPDAVLVTASVLSQYAVARELIPLGRPLLLEKPPGTSAAEAADLARLAARHHTPVMVALNRRFYSVLHRALDRVGGRAALTGVAVEWSEDPDRMRAAGHPPEVLARLVFANSLHGLDLLTLLLGPLRDVEVTCADADPQSPTPRWRMTADGVGETGASARFRSTWTPPRPWEVSLRTADARVVMAPLETAVVHGPGGAEAVEPDEDDRRFKPGLAGQARAFLDVVAGGPIRWPACSIEESLASMSLAEALTRACRAASPSRS